MPEYRLICADVLEGLAALPDDSVHCVVTSPPYWGLRDYGIEGQLGLEPTPELHVEHMVEVFGEVRRVLRKDGTLWLNYGDCYASGNRGAWDGNRVNNPASLQNANRASDFIANAPNRLRQPGLKPKDLVGMPWRVALALQQPILQCKGCGAKTHAMHWGRFPNGRHICPACEKSKGIDIAEFGWWLRSDIIWAKPNPMPESVTDRCTKAHEYLFLLTKSARYFYDQQATKKPLKYPQGSTNEDVTRAFSGKRSSAPIARQDECRVNGIVPSTANLKSVWHIATQPYPEAHFATFPEKLVEPCVLAGTSEKGCCPECGASWVRVIDVDYRNDDSPSGKAWSGNNRKGGSIFEERTRRHVRTLGWQPSCKCGKQAVPCIVFDPFCGSGTVGVVALKAGRDFIGIDLSAEYIQMARRRIQAEVGTMYASETE